MSILSCMDPELYDVVVFDVIERFKQIDGILSVCDQLTPTNNTVLHVACQHQSIECAKEILSAHESLLQKINSRGETALHLAARNGHFDVVVELIESANKSSLQQLDQNTSSTIVQTLIRTQDEELETALHAAVRYNHFDVVQLLVKEDPSHEHPQNKYNETPVYLAATRGYTDIIRTILQHCESPTFGGPDGRTALHAAVLDKARASMELLLKRRKDLIKVADNYGWTVYHYVAYNDLHAIVKDLVDVDRDRSVGNLSDIEHKRTPLHVAAYEGKAKVMAELISCFPDSWEIADGNGKNILHLAVEKDRQLVVNFIFLRLDFVKWNHLLTQRDNEGFTPLHLIAKSGHCYKELMHKRAKVDWQVLDVNNFTPLDVLQMTDSEQAEQAIVRRVFNRHDVKRYWNPWRLRKKLDLEEQRDKNRSPDGQIKRYKTLINTHMIVSALITTVALTAVFAMPGGFHDNQGSANLRNPAFKTFLVADAVALLCSMSSLFLYFVTSLSDDSVKVVVVLTVCVLLNSVSAVAMMLAFIFGTFAVLPHHLSNIAVTVCVISSLFIILAVCAFAYLFSYFVKAIRYS